MKKLLLTTLLLTLIMSSGNAQQLMDKMDPSSTGALYRNNVQNNKGLLKIEGSVYLNDDFREANISGVSQVVLIRYNAMSDMIEVQNEKKELFSLVKQAPYHTITVIPNASTIKLLNYSTKEGQINGYLVELFSSNDVAALRRDRVYLQKRKEAVNSYVAATPDKYVKAREEYYLSLKNETAIPMPKGRKDFQELFPSKKDEISSYFKKNDFSLKDERSIIDMAKFISTF